MKPGKSFATLLVLLSLLACDLPVGKAQGPCVGGMCRHGIARHRCLEVGCAPRSAFYNYYPTTWRRWPTDPTSAAPTPTIAPPADQEPVTPPADQPPGPQIEPDQPGQPQITPEDDTIVPSDRLPATTAPEPAPPLPADEEMLPFQDVPSSPSAAPPAQAPPPSPDAPPALPPDTTTDPGLPGLPPTTTPSIPEEAPGGGMDPLDDAPPTMPEDPFQDDPVQPPSAPPSPTGMNDAGGPALSQNTRDLPNTKLWRASSASLETGIPSAPTIAPSIAAESPAVAPSLLASYPTADREEALASADKSAPVSVEPEGPQLLPPGEKPIEELHRATLPHDAPARRNPLRTASMAVETGPAVVPAAAWTVDDAAKAGTGVKARRNPLRDR